ncbi:MAG: glutamyl-tRNA reductase [Rhodospirillales bacterium]|nr:glutamyl-tRNA reductase [Rhodospirillales bacterium]MBT4625936.1 glutamyl-tRNA reductase [Rhodospirillales bacterium]MBT5350709.1 glutamyl-tRNA reductase [Rhodospirillales bacterium]MBT5522071.1 glutamyl-tRNA reductase [Rhodospirillales bacterium]MBT6111507.1 glutamyl-tRNA reductase [Rhodospirillales bacterium]
MPRWRVSSTVIVSHMNVQLGKALVPVVVGANFRSSAMDVRDRMFVEDALVPMISERLSAAGVEQAIILSTCDRVEVQAVHGEPDVAATAIRKILTDHAELDPASVGDQLYAMTGTDALRQIMLVATSLDSQVLGEPQVLGQVKAAHRMAQTAGMMGPGLEAILQAAYATAKRVLTETKIGEHPVSIAAAAALLARDVHGDLSNCRVMLLGDGEMGELVGTYLMNAGAKHLSVAHPTDRRGHALAGRLECHAVPWVGLAQALPEHEIIITAIGARTYTLNADMLRAMVTGRRHQPSFAVDLGLPGDIDPAGNRIDEVFLYDLGDLERLAMKGLSHREGEAERARAIVEEDLALYARDKAERSAVPALSRLRAHVEALREQSLAEAGGDADKATHLLINRLLHDPSVVLREIAADGNEAELYTAERVIEQLFQLNKDTSGD